MWIQRVETDICIKNITKSNYYRIAKKARSVQNCERNVKKTMGMVSFSPTGPEEREKIYNNEIPQF